MAANEEVPNLTQTKKSRKRGFYGQYLYESVGSNMPRTSKHHLKKKMESNKQFLEVNQSISSTTTAAEPENMSADSDNLGCDMDHSEGQDDVDIHDGPVVISTANRKDLDWKDEICESEDDDGQNHTVMSSSQYQQDNSSSIDEFEDPALFSAEEDELSEFEEEQDYRNTEGDNRFTSSDEEVEEDSNCQNDMEDDEGSQPLYYGSQITVSVSIMLILTFITR
ncbi:uncharacterized protein [Clytia hemisphaerica]|uniref:uncharacterized protein n=1 Tax=Clytia hemisphaerica TaxID=252671 RepID=UPI0034D47C78